MSYTSKFTLKGKEYKQRIFTPEDERYRTISQIAQLTNEKNLIEADLGEAKKELLEYAQRYNFSRLQQELPPEELILKAHYLQRKRTPTYQYSPELTAEIAALKKRQQAEIASGIAKAIKYTEYLALH